MSLLNKFIDNIKVLELNFNKIEQKICTKRKTALSLHQQSK